MSEEPTVAAMGTQGKSETVEAAARALLAATTTGDLATLEALVAPEFTYTHASNARVDSREEWLESFRSGGRRYHVYDIFDLRCLDFGEVAVLQGRAHQEMSPRGEPIELNTRFTSVWVRGGGGWRVAGWQATRIAE